MANYKSTSKGELIAIYRLEFYKNKKKWKFCKNERLLKKDVPSKQKLNETYRVEDESPPEVDPPEPLNDAFLETDSDENLKEEPKPDPPPPSLRRWKNTLLDMKLPPDELDWAIPDVKAEQSWEPTIEPVRSYEDEWGEERGWEGVQRWGDDMQCVEQVYASELCVSGVQRSRLPVFAGWPAHTPPQTDQHMLRELMQNCEQRLTSKPSVADALRQQIDGVGGLGQSSGQLGQSSGHMGQSEGCLGQRSGNKEQSAINLRQPGQNKDEFGRNLQLGRNIGQLEHGVTQLGQNTGQLGYNVGNPGQNSVQPGEVFGHGQNMRQNTRILDHNIKRNQNFVYTEEPEVLKQNLYQNCKIGQIIEQNLRCDIGEKLDLGRMDWEPERDCCELGMGVGEEVTDLCVGDACVAGAVAALAEAEGWLTGDMKHFYLEPSLGEAPCLGCDASLSSGDSAAFVRGAHARPHSSELDLAVDTLCECANISANKLSHMSGDALRGALRGYTAAAQRVLHELRARAVQNNRQQPSVLSRDATQESLPTRDTQPQAPPGRGRGRRLLSK